MKDKDALDLSDLVIKSVSPAFMKEILDLVAQNSWWVPPKVYDNVQVVYPKTRRKHSKEEKGSIDDHGVRLWTNEPPIRAFWTACGKRPERVQGANICHLYEGSVHDPAHYTNLGNLTALPKSLASLSEWEPINSVLRYHSFKMYQYKGPKDIEPPKPDYYPSRWAVYQSDLSSEELDKVVKQLEHQRKDQPQYSQFRKKEGNEIPRSNTETLDDSSGDKKMPIPLPQGRSPVRHYVRGASCPQLGEEHIYVPIPGTRYAKCSKCNSTRTLYNPSAPARA